MLTNSKKIAYILWRFPVLSETFVLNEMVTLRKIIGDANLMVYSIKRSFDQTIHPQAKTFLHSDIYVPGLFSLKFWSGVAKFSMRKIFKVIAIWLQLIKEIPFSGSLRLMVYYFFQSQYCFLVGIYVAKLLEKQDVHHLHTHFAESSSLIVRIASFLLDKSYSFTSHAKDLHGNPNKKLIVNLVKNSKYAITISEFNKKYICSLDESLSDRIKIIHCGIDLKRFTPEHAHDSEKFRLLSVGRLIEKKGFKETIEACAKIPDSIRFEYKIIGSGPLENELRESIAENGLSQKVELLGPKTQQEVFALMAQSDVFVLFCKEASDGDVDGIPVALMEAMAMELPIISTKISGVPELVKAGSGLLVEEMDIHGLTEAIIELSNKKSEERLEMGKKGREIVSREFNLETEVTKLARLFNSN